MRASIKVDSHDRTSTSSLTDLQIAKINVSSYFVRRKSEAGAANAATKTHVSGVCSHHGEYVRVHAVLGLIIGCIRRCLFTVYHLNPCLPDEGSTSQRLRLDSLQRQHMPNATSCKLRHIATGLFASLHRSIPLNWSQRTLESLLVSCSKCPGVVE
jgi:hypothetical protein